MPIALSKRPRSVTVALSGGVGGAKLAAGLAAILEPQHLAIVCNTGDDFEHLGLAICPDLDTVMYTLGGRNNTAQGWASPMNPGASSAPWASSAATPGSGSAISTSQRTSID